MLELRRVGELDQEDLVAPGSTRIAVDGQSCARGCGSCRGSGRSRMIGAPHDLPGVAVVADMAAPGQRLEADAEAALGRALAELVEIGGGAIDAAERGRRDVASRSASGRCRAPASGRTCARRGRSRAPVAARACPRNRGTAGMCRSRARDRGTAAPLARTAVERQQIVLENLDRVRSRLAAMARSFSSRRPLSETVAIERLFMLRRPPWRRRGRAGRCADRPQDRAARSSTCGSGRARARCRSRRSPARAWRSARSSAPSCRGRASREDVRRSRCTSSGDRPIEGSSISISFGSSSSARAISSCFCSPPESVDACAPPCGAAPGNGPARPRSVRRRSMPCRRDHAAELEIVAHRQFGKDVAALRHVADAAHRAARAGEVGDVRALEQLILPRAASAGRRSP